MGADERRPLAHKVSDEARAGYALAAQRTRLSAASITEAIGLTLAREMRRPRAKWSPWLHDIVAEAERIYDERHFPETSDNPAE